MLFSHAALRQAHEVSQASVADAMGVSQPRVAKLEAAALEDVDPQLSTLARYIRAIGGELEVRARFGDRSYRLMGPPQKLPAPVAIDVSAEFDAEADRMLKEAGDDS